MCKIHNYMIVQYRVFFMLCCMVEIELIDSVETAREEAAVQCRGLSSELCEDPEAWKARLGGSSGG